MCEPERLYGDYSVDIVGRQRAPMERARAAHAAAAAHRPPPAFTPWSEACPQQARGVDAAILAAAAAANTPP